MSTWPAILARVRAHLASGGVDPRRDYLTQYAVFHEDMHTEAFTYTRQTLSVRGAADSDR